MSLRLNGRKRNDITAIQESLITDEFLEDIKRPGIPKKPPPPPIKEIAKVQKAREAGGYRPPKKIRLLRTPTGRIIEHVIPGVFLPKHIIPPGYVTPTEPTKARKPPTMPFGKPIKEPKTIITARMKTLKESIKPPEAVAEEPGLNILDRFFIWLNSQFNKLFAR